MSSHATIALVAVLLGAAVLVLLSKQMMPASDLDTQGNALAFAMESFDVKKPDENPDGKTIEAEEFEETKPEQPAPKADPPPKADLAPNADAEHFEDGTMPYMGTEFALV